MKLAGAIFGKDGCSSVRAIAAIFFVHGCVFGRGPRSYRLRRLSTPPLFEWMASSLSHATIFPGVGVPFLLVGPSMLIHSRFNLSSA
jgi:hypothetical protein